MKKTELETEYRKFLKVAKAWQALVSAHAVFHDTNSTGEAFRHVALTNDLAVLEEAEKLLSDWLRFVDVCKKAQSSNKGLNIVESLYTPVPFIIKDATHSAHIILQSATSTRIFTREAILKKYDAILKKSQNAAVFAPIIGALMEERKFFESEPEGEQYRARKEGYTDTIIATDLDGNNALSRFRVGSHGALVYSSNPGLKLPVIDKSGERRSITVYTGVNPVPCGPLGDLTLYRVRELERNQPNYVVKSYILRGIEFRNQSLKNRSERLLAESDPAIEHIVRHKINIATEALARLDAMDLALLDVMLESGDDLTGMKLTDARKKYGGQIEERFGHTFAKTQSAAKLR